MNIKIRLAKKVRRLRREYKITQEELAERSNLSTRYIQAIENLTKPPSIRIEIIEKLANGFKIKPSQLLEN